MKKFFFFTFFSIVKSAGILNFLAIKQLSCYGLTRQNCTTNLILYERNVLPFALKMFELKKPKKI